MGLGKVFKKSLDPLGAVDFLTGASGADAAKDAARIQSKAFGEGIEEQRRQFDTIQALLSPFVQEGTEQLPALQQGATAGGFASNIQDILSGGAFQPLIQERERSIRDILAQQGLTRSGAGLQELASIPIDTAFDIENMLRGRQTGLAQAGLGAAGSIGSFGSQAAGSIANLLGQQGVAQAGGILGAQQAKTQGIQSLLNLGAQVLPGMAASDKRLKKNIKKVGSINGINIYDFEANELGKKHGMTMTRGVIADELQVIHPELVTRMDNGYLAVNYHGLVNLLEAS